LVESPCGRRSWGSRRTVHWRRNFSGRGFRPPSRTPDLPSIRRCPGLALARRFYDRNLCRFARRGLKGPIVLKFDLGKIRKDSETRLARSTFGGEPRRVASPAPEIRKVDAPAAEPAEPRPSGALARMDPHQLMDDRVDVPVVEIARPRRHRHKEPCGRTRPDPRAGWPAGAYSLASLPGLLRCPGLTGMTLRTSY